MRMKQQQAQRIFESDMVEVLAYNKPLRSPYFVIETLRDHLVDPPRSIRCFQMPPAKHPTWVWLFAESDARDFSSVGYLIGQPKNWPSMHFEYGIATKRVGTSDVIIQEYGLKLLQALDRG